jgi:hypothetical protein
LVLRIIIKVVVLICGSIILTDKRPEAVPSELVKVMVGKERERKGRRTIDDHRINGRRKAHGLQSVGNLALFKLCIMTSNIGRTVQ